MQDQTCPAVLDTLRALPKSDPEGFLEYFYYFIPDNTIMSTGTEFKSEGLFVNWAAVIVSNVSAYMTVFINTVYFHISKLLLLVVFLRESNL